MTSPNLTSSGHKANLVSSSRTLLTRPASKPGDLLFPPPSVLCTLLGCSSRPLATFYLYADARVSSRVTGKSQFCWLDEIFHHFHSKMPLIPHIPPNPNSKCRQIASQILNNSFNHRTQYFHENVENSSQVLDLRLFNLF
jgi:hypothetical protein